MKVDFHCHTLAVRSGEVQSRNVTDELFASKIEDANVKVVAITNHDIFDEAQFRRLSAKVEGICMVWPGVELNVTDGWCTYHLNIVVNPNRISEFSKKLAALTANKSGDFSLSVDDVVNAFDPLDAIFLPHFGNKKPCITSDGLKYLSQGLRNKNRLILEDSNTRSTGILASHGMNTVTGSDVHDWNKYESSDLSELRLAIGSFEQFCKFLDRDPILIASLLDNNAPVKYGAQPCEEDSSILVPVSLYREVNIIFGDKGTGKSQIIKSIRRKMESNSVSTSAYISSEKENEMKSLLDTADMERLSAKLGRDDCIDDFQKLSEWGDQEPTQLQLYVDFAKTKDAKGNKERIKWIKMQVQAYNESHIQAVENDKKRIDAAIATISELKDKYLENDKAEVLTEQLHYLERAVNDAYQVELVEKYSTRLLQKSLQKIRNLVTAKTGIATKPITTGFRDYAMNRMKLFDAADKIITNLQSGEQVEHEPLGNLGHKGAVYISKRWKMLDDQPGHEQYKGSVGITVLKEAKKLLKKVRASAFSDDIEDVISAFKEYCEANDIDRTSLFVGIAKYTSDKNGLPYTLSNGEKSIILIWRKLSVEADAYLLDEPELSMSNSYIDEVIRPRITELGKLKKTVVIATHNANLAVRTLPYSTIYRSHDGRGYKTYVGNPFINKLVNIEDQNDHLDWKAVSMKVLEGGKDAFYDRGEIYEAGQ